MDVLRNVGVPAIGVEADGVPALIPVKGGGLEFEGEAPTKVGVGADGVGRFPARFIIARGV